MAQITVPYEEVSGSHGESLTRSSQGAKRVLRCNWADRLTLGYQLLGLDVNGPELTAATYPAAPLDFLFATAVMIQPEGMLIKVATNDAINSFYEKALLSVEYGNNNWGTDGQIIIEETLEYCGEFITLPSSQIYYLDADLNFQSVPDGSTPGVQLKQMNWQVTVSPIRTLPADAMALMGSVNEKAVVSRTLGWMFDAETLLFQGATAQRTIAFGKLPMWSMTSRWTARPKSWNLFPFPDNGTTPAKFSFQNLYVPTVFPPAYADFKKFNPYPTADFVKFHYGI